MRKCLLGIFSFLSWEYFPESVSCMHKRIQVKKKICSCQKQEIQKKMSFSPVSRKILAGTEVERMGDSMRLLQLKKKFFNSETADNTKKRH